MPSIANTVACCNMEEGEPVSNVRPIPTMVTAVPLAGDEGEVLS